MLIELQSQQLQIKPKEFYIAAVTDQRKNKLLIGKLQPYNGAVPKISAPYNTDIKGGSLALRNYLTNSVPADKGLRPVIFSLKELYVSEEPAGNGVVKGTVKLVLSFALRRTYDPVELTDYNTTTTYQRRAGPAQYIEPILRSALNNGITYFNNWMDANAGNNIKLAKAVKVSFTDYNTAEEGDTIYYSAKRPLRWDDFKGKPTRGSQHGAEIFSGLGYTEDVKLKEGIVYVTLSLKTWAAKSACWVYPGINNDYALNHEQRHFDITRIVTEHFKKNIASIKLPPDNFDGDINMAYLDALREINTMQKQYDTETSHSQDAAKQQQWDNRIDAELATLGIKQKAN